MPERLNVFADFTAFEGYGSLAELTSLSLRYQAGIDVSIYPRNIVWKIEELFRGRQLSSQLTRSFVDRFTDKSAPTYFFCTPDPGTYHLAQSIGGTVFINTMYESNLVPRFWVPALNDSPVVVVPSRFLVPAMRDSGVRSDIVVVPEGFDPLTYKYIERPERRTITTLFVGPLNSRKNAQQLIEGWSLAFMSDKSARLILKGKLQIDWVNNDPRIVVDESTSPTRGIAHIYRDADVLVAVGSEGFGLPLVEASATGLPVVAMSEEGQADICRAIPQLIMTVPGRQKRPIDHLDDEDMNVGEHWVPSAEDIADRLTWFKLNRDTATKNAKLASQWMHQHRNIWNKGPKLVEVLQKYGAWN